MRVYKKDIVREIRQRYPKARCEIGKTAMGKGVIEIECWHGECDRIGQFVLKTWPNQIYTYFACHVFRKGRLSIYFKR